MAFGVWRLAFGVWRSAFGVRRLAFGVRRLVPVWQLRVCVNIRRRSDTGKGRVDEGICRHDLAHYGRAITPTDLLVHSPFRPACLKLTRMGSRQYHSIGYRLFVMEIAAPTAITPLSRSWPNCVVYPRRNQDVRPSGKQTAGAAQP